MLYVRKGFTLTLLIVVLFGAGYFYYIAQAVCPAPITYKLGELDTRFNLTTQEARVALSEAESVWEDATGRNLFSFEDEGELTVNFVYDDRQEFITEEEEFKSKLNETENMSEDVNNTYDDLVAKYNELKESYTKRIEAYETQLRSYNEEVEKYNNQGGAPEKVYARLQTEKNKLDVEQRSLNELSNSLNALVKQINDIGEKGNLLLKTYNKGVEAYNKTYGKPREFTQGDYTENTIHIYTFKDRYELKTVLVHELGHALSLGHVEGEESIMHHLIGAQPQAAGLSENDLAEFNRVCGSTSLFERIRLSLQR
jgi:predicted RND superfamily exporter protein